MTTSRSGFALSRLTKRLREKTLKTFSRTGRSGEPGGGETCHGEVGKHLGLE